MHQIGMGELADRVNFALKTPNNLFVIQQVLPDHFQGDNPVHVLMAGLVNLAGSTLSDSLEDDVRADDQVGHSSLKDQVELIRREPSLLQQLLSQILGVLMIRLQM